MNDHSTNSLKVFNLCCIALTVTSMTFAIRAGILGQLGTQFGLSDTELGWINSMAFLGFPLAMMVGGALYNMLGARMLVSLAFICHLLGLILTIISDGFWGLLISTFLVGFANGAVEAGCNPLVAELYPQEKTRMLNRFHVWFPGGIVIGALLSKIMTSMGLGWQWQVGIILLPTLLYGALLLRSTFPQFDAAEHSTVLNFKHLFSPIYLFLALCMTLTATTELGTQQWIERILGASGASPMIILAMITGLMAIGRYFAGPLIHRLNPVGVLLASSIFAAAGIFALSQAQGLMVYPSAILFAIGVTYFWPTMIGCVAEYTPKTGPLGLSIMGGLGVFAVSIWNPIIGSWIDTARNHSQALNLSPEAVELATGQAVLIKLFIFPVILIVAFSIFYWWMKKSKIFSSEDTQAEHATSSVNMNIK
ncbi:MFS transporter [Agarilytica rhodophyticola]|uniref:MFS transporter n=1 Tax=Agarilytica rhodophyticola TaxID=1737490 RepID=UPI000B344971|nr:MFS transporter [Agarilytica rhodophyticola]